MTDIEVTGVGCPSCGIPAAAVLRRDENGYYLYCWCQQCGAEWIEYITDEEAWEIIHSWERWYE